MKPNVSDFCKPDGSLNPLLQIQEPATSFAATGKHIF